MKILVLSEDLSNEAFVQQFPNPLTIGVSHRAADVNNPGPHDLAMLAALFRVRTAGLTVASKKIPVHDLKEENGILSGRELTEQEMLSVSPDTLRCIKAYKSQELPEFCIIYALEGYWHRMAYSLRAEPVRTSIAVTYLIEAITVLEKSVPVVVTAHPSGSRELRYLFDVVLEIRREPNLQNGELELVARVEDTRIDAFDIGSKVAVEDILKALGYPIEVVLEDV